MTHTLKSLPPAVARLRLAVATGSLALLTAGPVLAQAAGGAATAATGTIGAQVNTMSAEGISAGGNLGTAACYTLALVCLIGGAWALWQSRQVQNREGGRVGMGIAGLVLCGLFAAGGVWINKAANTTSGGNATITDTPGMIAFGGGGATGG